MVGSRWVRWVVALLDPRSIPAFEAEATLMPTGLYGKCSLEFGVIVVNLKAMVAGMSDSLRRDFEVLCLAGDQGCALPTVIGLL